VPAIITIIIIMKTSIIMAETAIYDLLSWMSPSYPIGAFAHSSGLEYAVEAGHVVDRVSTENWISDQIDNGAILTDLLIFVHCHRATIAGDRYRLLAVAELALASLTSRERTLEGTAQGAAFRRIARATAPAATLAMLDVLDDGKLNYAVAVACLTAGHDIPLELALTGYLHAVVANLVSAAQRLVPLGQTDGQLAMRNLAPTVFAAVAIMAAMPDDDPFEQMGSATLYADLACMAHETQYTRLFRT
jgi:urease accessory protein